MQWYGDWGAFYRHTREDQIEMLALWRIMHFAPAKGDARKPLRGDAAMQAAIVQATKRGR